MTKVISREDIELTTEELSEAITTYLRSKEEMTEDESVTDIFKVSNLTYSEDNEVFNNVLFDVEVTVEEDE